MLIEYDGEIEQDPAAGKESMMLLMGDAWHAYARELDHDPVETMALIDDHVKADEAKNG